ncbi:hypothetical protein MRB53_035942 [Persea americana]|uniref:Uncharacterized protein n=1 Tax=Persea americana TaxID=3435 RepID=A0ACC2K622_PERAE|nr:hypothetical protein MRB53_035942 [Persea americana]
MLIQRRDVVFLFLLTFSCFPTFGSGATILPPEEMDALQQIGNKLGKKNWNYSANPCTGESGWSSPVVTNEYENVVKCTCITNDTFCHVESIVLRGQNLQGKLPPELAKLPSLKEILMSSNAFSEQLPTNLANLTNLTDLINDNNFTGRIPDFIKDWIQLDKLAIQGSGLQGPIPSEISSLVQLTDLRISDINGTASPFPELSNMKKMKTLKGGGSSRRSGEENASQKKEMDPKEAPTNSEEVSVPTSESNSWVAVPARQRNQVNSKATRPVFLSTSSIDLQMTASKDVWKSFLSFLQHRDFASFGESTSWLCLGLDYLQLVNLVTMSARQLGNNTNSAARQWDHSAS